MKKELLNLQLASLKEECPYPDRRKGLFFIHDFDYNGNGLKIPEELASEYLDSLNGAPLVAYYNAKTDDIENHKEVRDSKGKIISLNTDACGTLFNAHIGSHEINGEDKYGVWADGYLWLRFENTLNVVENLMEQNGHVDISVECQVGGYEFSEEGRTAQKYLNYFGTALLGSRYVGAYSDAGLYALNNLEVAEAYQKDLLTNKQDEQSSSLDININSGGGNVLKFLLELNADGTQLSFAEMRRQMNDHLNKIGKMMTLKRQMQSLNALDTEMYNQMADSMLAMMPQDRSYFDFWIPEDSMFEGYCICSDWGSNMLIMMDWNVENNEITVSNPRKARIQYIEVNSDDVVLNSLAQELSEIFKKNEELNQNNQTLTQTIEQKDQELNTKLAELNEQKTQIEQEKSQLETEVSQLKETAGQVQTKDDALIQLNNQINGLKEEIASLLPIKEEYNQLQEQKRQAEIAEKQESLRQYAIKSKVIEEKELTENQELNTAITEINESYVKALIADRIVENAKNLEVNEKENIDIIISTQEPEDLIPMSAKDQMYAPKKK